VSLLVTASEMREPVHSGISSPMLAVSPLMGSRALLTLWRRLGAGEHGLHRPGLTCPSSRAERSEMPPFRLECQPISKG